MQATLTAFVVPACTCLSYLLDRAAAANGVKRAKHTHQWKPAAIVLDIEGTVAPISFVADVMFPHARDNVRTYLESHYNSAEARADIDAIRKQVRADAVVGRHCDCVAGVLLWGCQPWSMADSSRRLGRTRCQML